MIDTKGGYIMNKQNILIGAMTVAIAALGIITYQQQHYYP